MFGGFEFLGWGLYVVLGAGKAGGWKALKGVSGVDLVCH